MEKIMDLEFDGVLEALAGKDVCVEEERRYYPLYRGYPNGSKKYYERLRKEEDQFFDEAPEFLCDKIGIFDYLKNIQTECVEELRSIVKKFSKKLD